jgi:hypothetical protein
MDMCNNLDCMNARAIHMNGLSFYYIVNLWLNSVTSWYHEIIIYGHDDDKPK